jgi:hypothetical protein
VTSEVLVAIGTLGTAAGVALTAWQLILNRWQARTQFEDGLTERYRDLVRELPIGAFLNEELSEEEMRDARGVFYRYFDLCNEQAFLSSKNRVSDPTWSEWLDGIESNMRRKAFQTAWLDEMAPCIGGDFVEFRAVLEGFEWWT